MKPIKEPVKKLLTHRYAGRGSALGSVVCAGALIGTDPAPEIVDMEPPAIVVEAAPRPELLPEFKDFYPPAIPQPPKVEIERVVSETERVDNRGKPLIHRTFEPAGEEIDTEAYRGEIEAWVLNFMQELRENLTEFKEEGDAQIVAHHEAFIEFIENPVYVETQKDIEQLQQHTTDIVTIIRRILDRAEGGQWPLVLGALLGPIWAMFTEPKKQPEPKESNAPQQ